DLSDGTQTGRLLTLTTASQCGAGRACPGTFDTLPRHYDAYTYVNTSNTAVCVTVELTPACLNGAQVQSAAYLGSFNPQNLFANYLGATGPIPDLLGGSYSFTVPAGQTFVVTVNEFLPLALCTGYDLVVSSTGGLTCPAANTPTPTPNAATQTAIAA